MSASGHPRKKLAASAAGSRPIGQLVQDRQWCYNRANNRVTNRGGGHPAMRREMVWVENERFRGWACSECTWEFNPSGVPAGNSIAEMKQNYERQRASEFQSHLCAKHPKTQKASPSRPRHLRRPTVFRAERAVCVPARVLDSRQGVDEDSRT